MTRRAVARTAGVLAVAALLGLPAHVAQGLVGPEQSSHICDLDPLPEGFEDLKRLVGLDVHAAADELRSTTRLDVRVVPDEMPDVDPVLVWRIGLVRIDDGGDYVGLNSGYEIVICAGTAIPDTAESVLDEAGRLLEERTLVPTWLPTAADGAWTVASSEPAAGTLVAFGTEVTLTAVPPSIDTPDPPPVVDDPPPVVDDPPPDVDPSPPVVDPPSTPRVPTPDGASAYPSKPAPRTTTPGTPRPPASTQSPSATPGGSRVGPSESTTPLVNDDPVVPPALGVAVGAALVAAWAVAGALARVGAHTGEGEPGDPARSVSVRVVGGHQSLDLLELPAVRPGRSLRIHLRPGRAAEGDRTRLHDPTENGGGSHG